MPTKKTSKNPKKNPPPPPEILKNPQKTLPRPPKTLKKPSPETFLRVLAIECVTKGGARAQARAPPLWLHLKARTHKNVSGEGFLRVLGGRGRVF